jgi:multicomponent Na+:H+ antiporter subunit E
MFGLRFLLLFLTWCAFSGIFDPFHLTLGVLSSAWVAAVSTHITLSQPHSNQSKNLLVMGAELVGYNCWLLVEVLKANVQVLKLSFSRNPEEALSPVIVEFRTDLADDFSRFLLAHSITLTPGTVTVRIDGDRFIVHALTETMGAGVPGAMETRLLKIFGGVQEPDHDH